MAKVTIYGLGGFDSAKPNNNIIEQYEVDDSESVAKEQARQSALSRLRDLGLNDDEITALGL